MAVAASIKIKAPGAAMKLLTASEISCTGKAVTIFENISPDDRKPIDLCQTALATFQSTSDLIHVNA